MSETEELLKIREYSEACKKELPDVDTINNFASLGIELTQDILARKECAERLRQLNEEYAKQVSEFNSYNSLQDRLKESKEENDKLSETLAGIEEQYEKLKLEKQNLSSTMEDFQMDEKLISSYKLATLSNFSFKKKIKYGYFLNKETLHTKTFPLDVEKNDPDIIQERWDNLNAFITSDQLLPEINKH